MFNEEITREEKRITTVFLVLDILHIIVNIVVLVALSCFAIDLIVNRQMMAHGTLVSICVGLFLYKFIKMLCTPEKSMFTYLIKQPRKEKH